MIGLASRRARRAALVASLLWVIACAGIVAAAPAPLPELTRPVHDFANVVDAASAAQLDRYIRELQLATGDVIVVVTMPTYQPDYGDIRDYSVKLFENHGRGIGDKEKDNGLLVVLAVQDRKLWIEVGYGLEGAITDGFAGETSRLYMAPSFREGRYGEGLLKGVARLIARIADERNVTVADLPRLARERRAAPQQRGIPLNGIVVAIFVLLLIYFLTPRNRMGPPRGGGRLTRRGGSIWGPTIGGSSWSGWSGGGSFGGGSFGGGFGGFGGGGSGGGGGGSSW
jgi:uncharacterized protein